MKTYKIEIKLNQEQERLYKLNISASRFVYNLFISVNKDNYSKNLPYINNYEFSKWFNNVYIKENKDMEWLKLASSKHIRKTIDNCNLAFKKFFKKESGFPRFKKATTSKNGYYFVRNGSNNKIFFQRNKIKIPCLGFVTFKEMNYLPQNSVITSGIITKRANKYFISLLTENTDDIKYNCINEGIGIDLGIKELATCSNGLIFKNVNKTNKIKKLEKRLKRQQRSLSRKLEFKKKNKDKSNYKNIQKNKQQIEKTNYRLECIRNDYINKCVDFIIKNKPSFITLEKLNIKSMLKNRHLSKAIQEQKFYYFKQILINKCTKNNIEIREVDTFFPSSKTCSKCGNIKKDLKLKDRIYKCKCGLEIDRDLNASINLKNATQYKILNTTTGGLPGSNAYGQHKNLLVANSESMLVEIRKSQFVDKFFDLVYTINVEHSSNKYI